MLATVNVAENIRIPIRQNQQSDKTRIDSWSSSRLVI